MPTTFDNEVEIDVRILLLTLFNNAKLIVGLTSLAGLIAVVVTLMMPNYYSSRAVFLPPKTSGKFSGMLSQLAAIPFLGGTSVTGSAEAEPLEVLKAHLFKKANVLKVVEKFALKAHYDINSSLDIDIIEEYRSHLRIEIDKETGLVIISFEDMKPEFARDIVNYNLNLLSKISKTTVITENQKKKVFLEDRLRQAEFDLQKIEDKIKLYEEKHQILSIDSQAKATIDAASQLQAEIIVNRIKLKVKTELGIHDSHPEIKVLRLEIEALEKQIKEIVDGGLIFESFLSDVDQAKGLTYVPLSHIPSIKLDLERLMREKAVQQEIFKVLAKESELAKIEASKDQEIIEVIEWAETPERKSRPKRALICIAVTLVAFLLACFFVLIRDTWYETKPAIEKS